MSNIVWFDRSLGAPAITVAQYGIVFNRASVEALGEPEYVLLGFDPKTYRIFAKPASESEENSAFPFRARKRHQDGSVRVNNKDFIRMLCEHMEIVLEQAEKCVAKLDKNTGMLVAEIPVNKADEDEDSEDEDAGAHELDEDFSCAGETSDDWRESNNLQELTVAEA